MIELRNVTIQVGAFRLCDLSMKIPSGCYAVLMGRTGRGKTTILEAICGLRRIVAGQILIHDTDVTQWSPSDRQIGYVPQDHALFPNMSVREHLEFALKLRKYSQMDRRNRSNELGDMLGIRHLLDRGIQHLSGGESQRVALGRALSFRPSILLLDEPLSALDETTRAEMHVLLKRISETTGVTSMHVTHNTDESHALAALRFRLESEGLFEESIERKEGMIS